MQLNLRPGTGLQIKHSKLTIKTTIFPLICPAEYSTKFIEFGFTKPSSIQIPEKVSMIFSVINSVILFPISLL